MTNKNDNNKDVERDFYDEEMTNEEIDNNEEDSEYQEDNEDKIDETEILKGEVKKEKDNFLRLFAEFENYKKRTTRERIELYTTANREVLTAMLPIMDDFERGLLEVEKSNDTALLDGMTLIYNKFKNTLEEKGLKVLEVNQGDKFDAEIHEAISQIPAPSKKLRGKIIDVVEKGYKLGETIIRYPKVVIGN